MNENALVLFVVFVLLVLLVVMQLMSERRQCTRVLEAEEAAHANTKRLLEEARNHIVTQGRLLDQQGMLLKDRKPDTKPEDLRMVAALAIAGRLHTEYFPLYQGWECSVKVELENEGDAGMVACVYVTARMLRDVRAPYLHSALRIGREVEDFDLIDFVLCESQRTAEWGKARIEKMEAEYKE